MSISSIASQATQALGGAHAHHHHGKASASGTPATSGGSILDQISSALTGAKPAASGSQASDGQATGPKLPGVGAAVTQLGSDLLSTLSSLLNGTGASGGAAGTATTSGQAASAYAASSALGA